MYNTEACVYAESDPWDEAYDSDDDASDCSYESASEEEAPPTPVLAYEPFRTAISENESEGDDYEDGLHPIVKQEEPWAADESARVMDDGEDMPYHFHYLAAPPARRRHPFKDAVSEETAATPRSRVMEHEMSACKQAVRLQDIWPEHGWC